MFKANAPVEISFVVAAPAADIRQKIVQSLKMQGGRIKVDNDSTIVAGFGAWWKVRLLGTFLAGVSAMPREIAVTMNENSGRTRVSVVVRDTFGFGSRFGVSQKLEDLMRENALAVQNLFPGSTRETAV